MLYDSPMLSYWVDILACLSRERNEGRLER